ncbi:hypothetical protein B0F90DRAFT_1817902 [Multifurca ochricompacta]|uniref:Uncharacterized protein n=1 Tax=Multifurca ochricompacta TaxID=376703 RepID=A0AAD4M2F5_9AGAM|nr:hypothetical protein B0F90DRAFT_1817902 [Multifurca ochricompacta]
MPFVELPAEITSQVPYPDDDLLANVSARSYKKKRPSSSPRDAAASTASPRSSPWFFSRLQGCRERSKAPRTSSSYAKEISLLRRWRNRAISFRSQFFSLRTDESLGKSYRNRATADRGALSRIRDDWVDGSPMPCCDCQPRGFRLTLEYL